MSYQGKVHQIILGAMVSGRPGRSAATVADSILAALKEQGMSVQPSGYTGAPHFVEALKKINEITLRDHQHPGRAAISLNEIGRIAEQAIVLTEREEP